MSKLDIITIGDTSMDTFIFVDEDEFDISCDVRTHIYEVCFNLADKIPIRELFQYPGGNANNAAVSFSRLGLKTGIYTILGNDPIGDRLIINMKEQKLSMKYVRRDGKTNSSFIINVKGERTIFSYHEKRVYRLPQIEKVKWVYITSMKDGSNDVLHSLMSHIRYRKPKITYNPGSFQLRESINASQALLRMTTLLVLNRDEAASWLKKPITTGLKKLMSEYHSYGVQNIVITDGQNGSFGYDGNAFYFCPIMSKDRLETTGAGDSFASAVTTALFYEIPLKEAMRWGTINANFVVNKIGGQPGLQRLFEMKHQLNRTKDKLVTEPLTE